MASGTLHTGNKTDYTGITGVSVSVKHGVACIEAAVAPSTANAWVEIGTLPSGYRPHLANIYLTVVETSTFTTGAILIFDNGSVQIKAPKAGYTYVGSTAYDTN